MKMVNIFPINLDLTASALRTATFHVTPRLTCAPIVNTQSTPKGILFYIILVSCTIFIFSRRVRRATSNPGGLVAPR